jgi:hypothetical protein
MISGNGKGAKDMNADSLLMKPRQITYGYTDYGFFSVEKVYINGEANGEYHIKLSDDSSHQHAVLFFSMHLKGCEVGMIDPILSVEYPIYVRSKEKDIDSLFTELNKLIEEFRRKAE